MRRPEENVAESPVSPQPRGIPGWITPLWTDRPVRWLALAGLLLCILHFVYLKLVYSSLPSSLALHWNSQAQVDVVGDPQELLRLPLFGLVVWALNVVIGLWALQRERAATFFLLAGAIAVEIMFTAGAISIVLRAS